MGVARRGRSRSGWSQVKSAGQAPREELILAKGGEGQGSWALQGTLLEDSGQGLIILRSNQLLQPLVPDP